MAVQNSVVGRRGTHERKKDAPEYLHLPTAPRDVARHATHT